jgi:hypothetical protein
VEKTEEGCGKKGSDFSSKKSRRRRRLSTRLFVDALKML